MEPNSQTNSADTQKKAENTKVQAASGSAGSGSSGGSSGSAGSGSSGGSSGSAGSGSSGGSSGSAGSGSSGGSSGSAGSGSSAGSAGSAASGSSGSAPNNPLVDLVALLYNAAICPGQVYQFKAFSNLYLPGYTHTIDFTNSNTFSSLSVASYTATKVDYEISMGNAILKNLGLGGSWPTPDTAVCKVSVISSEIGYYSPLETKAPIITGVIPAIIDGSQNPGTVQLADDGCYYIVIPTEQGAYNDIVGSNAASSNTGITMATLQKTVNLWPNNSQVASIARAEVNIYQNEGSIQPLKIGSQVLLSFQEGNPDIPIIVGCVATTANPNLITSANQQNVTQYYGPKITPAAPVQPPQSVTGSASSGDTEANKLNYSSGQVVTTGAYQFTYSGTPGNEGVNISYPDGSTIQVTPNQMKTLTAVNVDSVNLGNTNSVTFGNNDSVTYGNVTYNTHGNSTSYTYGNSYSETRGDSVSYIYGSDISYNYSNSVSYIYGDSISYLMGSSALNITLGNNLGITIGTGGFVFFGVNMMSNMLLNLSMNFGLDIKLCNAGHIDKTLFGDETALINVNRNSGVSSTEEAPLISKLSEIMTYAGGVLTLNAESIVIDAGVVMLNAGVLKKDIGLEMDTNGETIIL